MARKPRLIGRSEELSRLVAALHRSRERGADELLVAGEAGIGKTRPVTELAQIARAESATVLVGGCLPIGAPRRCWPTSTRSPAVRGSSSLPSRPPRRPRPPPRTSSA
jgi:predicted ATPase